MITAEIARQLLDYDPNTGIFIWKKRDVSFFNDGVKWSAETNMKKWNTRYAGTRSMGVYDFDGYLHGTILGKEGKAHRIAWLITYGYWPNEIDHINGIRDDNRISNLRDVTRKENALNIGKQRRSKSKIAGVRKYSYDKTWRVIITFNGNCRVIGRYDDFFEACCARKSAENKHGFSDRHGI